MSQKIKVLYVIGKGRSGSTLLDRMLGELDGYISTGELWKIWKRGVLEGEPCGCGETLVDCEFWRPILGNALQTHVASDLEDLRAEGMQWRQLPRLLMGQPSPAYKEAAKHFSALYQRIASQTGAKVIVDSSKWPLHPGLWGHIDEVEPYAVLLLRHPYAVAHSWQRRKKYHGSKTQQWMRQFPPWHSGLSWAVRAEVSQYVLSRLNESSLWIRYEDLIERPQVQLQKITSVLGEPVLRFPFMDGQKITFHRHHTVGGNPNRFESGVVELRTDNEWEQAMNPRDKQLLRLLTRRSRHRFGYEHTVSAVEDA